MKKFLVATVMLVSLASVAHAGSDRRLLPKKLQAVKQVTAPEIDPASASSALALLLGGLTVLRGRMGKK